MSTICFPFSMSVFDIVKLFNFSQSNGCENVFMYLSSNQRGFSQLGVFSYVYWPIRFLFFCKLPVYICFAHFSLGLFALFLYMFWILDFCLIFGCSISELMKVQMLNIQNSKVQGNILSRSHVLSKDLACGKKEKSEVSWMKDLPPMGNAERNVLVTTWAPQNDIVTYIMMKN